MERPENAGGARDTRRVILDAALDLFAEHGYAGTSMRALARAAGVRESALYHHFPSKDALFMAVVQGMVERRVDSAAAELRSLAGRPLEETLTRMVYFFVRRFESPDERKFMRIVFTEGARLAEISGKGGGWEALFQRHRETMRGVLSEVLLSKNVRADIPFEIFGLHFAAPILLYTNSPMGKGKGPIDMPLERFVKEHVDFILRAITPREDPR